VPDPEALGLSSLICHFVLEKFVLGNSGYQSHFIEYEGTCAAQTCYFDAKVNELQCFVISISIIHHIMWLISTSVVEKAMLITFMRKHGESFCDLSGY
jgi:hypothetical protein